MKIARHFAALIGLLWATAPLCATSVRTVSLSYEVIPGGHIGFSLPVINNSGQTAFLNGWGVSVSSPNSYDDGNRAWSEANGKMSLVSALASQAPELPTGVNFAFFNRFGFSDSGVMVLRANLIGFGVTTSNQFATYLESSTGLRLISRDGDPAPGVPNATFGSVDSLYLNDAGNFILHCNLRSLSGTGGQSFWTGDIGQLDLLAKAGTLPGTFTGSTFREPTLNDSGMIAFAVAYSAIWAGHPGSLSPIALGTDVAPGTSGQTFGSLVDPVINNASHVAFFASLDGGGWGIWSNRSGALSLIARDGEHAPGTPEDVVFLQSIFPVLNDADRVLFGGLLVLGEDVTSANDSGLWSDTSGSMQLVIREGDAAPGTSTGVLFGQFDTNSYVLNADNQIAFLGRLTGTDVTTANDVGIWATDATGEIHLIAREGNQLEVSPGDTRTIKELMFFSGTGNADSRPSGFNDAGQLAYWARFTDNSEGLFVSYLVAESIPGDFNHDGRVDSADYVAWRKTDGTQLGYNTWRTHFGLALPPTGVGAASIPEPATSVLAIACFGTLLLRDRFRPKGRKRRPSTSV